MNYSNIMCEGLNPSVRYLRKRKRKDLTYILGSRCKDGVVLVGDRKETSLNGNYVGYDYKIFQHLNEVVWGAAGAVDYFNSFRERVRITIIDKGGVQARHFLPLIEDIHGHLIQTFGEYFIDNFGILIAPRTGNSALYLIQGQGGHRPIPRYETIGSGSPYGKMLLKLLWKPEMGMKEVAELGYFIIKIIEHFELDATVGLDTKPPHDQPQIWFIPDNPQLEGSSYGDDPTIREANPSELQTFSENAQRKLSRLDKDFATFLKGSM